MVMRVGAAVVDITPEVGCELSGYVARVQPSVGVHSRLFLRALRIDDGTTRLLWLHGDLVGLDAELAAAIKARVGAVVNLPPEHIVVSATHTHAGPCTIKLINCGDYDEAYAERLCRWCVEAGRRAMEKPVDVEMRFAQVRCDLAVDRRQQASAHTDPVLGVLAFCRPDGGCVAVVANYAMHNVALGPENRHISGDVAGQAVARLQERLAGRPVVLFTNGACGNLNPPSRADFEQAERWGDQLAQTVAEALDRSERTSDQRLRVASDVVDVPLDAMDASAIEAVVDRLERGCCGQTGYVADRIREAGRIWRRRMLERIESGKLPTSARMPLTVVSLGGTVWPCLPAEVFSIMTAQLREACARPLQLVGFANGDIGYLPTRQAYKEGGYETESAFVFYDSFRPAVGAFEDVRDRIVRLIGSV